MPEERPQEEIDLWELFSVLWHWRKVLLAFVVIGTLLAGGVAYLIPNTYQSEARILPLGGEGSKLLTYTLTKSATGFSGMASLGNLALQNARSEILGALSGQSLYLDIVEKYHLTQRISAKTPQEAAEKLRKMVSFQDDPKTGVIVIRVKGRTPQEAKELGEYVLKTLKENLRNSFVNSLQNQINELDKIMASTKDTYVLNKLENMKLNLLEELLEAQIDPDWKFKVVDPPSTPVEPSSPKRLLILGVGFIGSLFLGVFVVLLMEYVKSRRGAFSLIFLLIAFGVSFLLCWWMVRYWGVKDVTEGVQKFHSWDAVRTGGVALYGSMLAVGGAFWWVGKDFWGEFFKVLVVSLPVFLGGLAEDITKRVSPRVRLSLAFLSGFMGGLLLDAHLLRVDVPFVDPLLAKVTVFSLLFTSFALAGSSNAFNIIDGFNGLAGGVGIIVFLAYAYVSFLLNDWFLLYLSLAFASALLGFFLWNFPMGFVFLGDSGAYLSGFLAGLVGVLMVNRHSEVSAWFPLTLLFYPIWETLFSILRKKFLRGTSPFEPDPLHFHMMIHRRIVKMFLGEVVSERLKNSLTSPYLWFMQILCTVPAVLFWKSTPLLVLSCVLYATFYVWLYFRIVSFKTPSLLKGFLKLLK